MGDIFVVVCAEGDRERRRVADDGLVLGAPRLDERRSDLLEIVLDVVGYLIDAREKWPERAGLVFPGNVDVTEEGKQRLPAGETRSVAVQMGEPARADVAHLDYSGRPGSPPVHPRHDRCDQRRQRVVWKRCG